MTLLSPGFIAQILDRRRIAEDCECGLCQATKIQAALEGYECPNCGFRGKPAAAECACCDSTCRVGKAGQVAGCPHGALVCPVCGDGREVMDPWKIVKELREAIR